MPIIPPDMRGADASDEWKPCPQCPGVLLPLRDYEIQKSSESPGVGADVGEFLLFGWWAFILNFVDDAWSFGGRKKRLAALKAEVLPQFPRSLVCPRCLHVVKRA